MSKRDPRTPFIPDYIPSEPFQVGITKSNEPIWVDPVSFAETPDIKQERKKNYRKAQAEGTLQEVERKVYQAAQVWLESRLVKIIPNEVYAAVKRGNLQAGSDWLTSHGFSYEATNTGDEYKVVLMHKGSEISRFVARRQDFAG